MIIQNSFVDLYGNKKHTLIINKQNIKIMTNSNSINSVLQSPFNIQFTTKESKRFAGWGYNTENVYVQ